MQQNSGSFGSHDIFDVNSHPEVLELFEKGEEVLFSCIVKKINKHRVSQRRVLVVTNKYLYNICLGNILTNLTRLLTHKSILRRKINIEKISEITLSTHPSSEQFIIHVEGEYDYRFNGGGNRDQIIQSICRMYFGRSNKFFTFNLNNAQDLKDFQTTDDDLRAHVDRRQRHGKIYVKLDIIEKGIDYIISNKDLFLRKESSRDILELQTGLFCIPEACMEQSTALDRTQSQTFTRDPISSIEDIALTTSTILPLKLI